MPAQFETVCTAWGLMSLKRKKARPISSYDECIVHLLSAFFCVTGRTKEDKQLRSAIEAVLTTVTAAKPASPSSNVIQFCRELRR
jgi:hypothetical protein